MMLRHARYVYHAEDILSCPQWVGPKYGSDTGMHELGSRRNIILDVVREDLVAIVG